MRNGPKLVRKISLATLPSKSQDYDVASIGRLRYAFTLVRCFILTIIHNVPLMVKIRAGKKTPVCGPMLRATYEKNHSGPHAFTKLRIFTSNDKILKLLCDYCYSRVNLL